MQKLLKIKTKNLIFVYGLKDFIKGHFFLLPNFYITSELSSVYEERHYIAIQFVFAIFGAGLKIHWANKKYVPFDAGDMVF